MDQQTIAQHFVEIISGIGGFFLLIFKYKDVIEFSTRVIKLLWKPFHWLIALFKMPFRLNEEAIAARGRMDAVEKTLNDLTKFIKKELTYNGGSSTLDAIRRIENRIIEQEYAQNALLLDSENGYFRCSDSGSNKWVNRTFARYLGCGTSELLGLGWKKFIKTEELRRYNEVWQTAFQDGCEFEDEVEFINVNHQVIKLKISACPIVDDKGQVLSYVGTVVSV
jgi:PAS domain S-box-containing protein